MRKITIRDGEIRTEGFDCCEETNTLSINEFTEFISNLGTHIKKAERKHPLFGNKLYSKKFADSLLELKRHLLKIHIEEKVVDWLELLECEIVETQLEIQQGEYNRAIDELMDCAAVIYRQYAVLRKLKEEQDSKKSNE